MFFCVVPVGGRYTNDIRYAMRVSNANGIFTLFALLKGVYALVMPFQKNLGNVIRRLWVILARRFPVKFARH